MNTEYSIRPQEFKPFVGVNNYTKRTARIIESGEGPVDKEEARVIEAIATRVAGLIFYNVAIGVGSAIGLYEAGKSLSEIV